MRTYTVTFYDPLSQTKDGPRDVQTQKEFAFLLGSFAHRLYAMPREIGWQFHGEEPEFVQHYRNTRYIIEGVPNGR